MSLFPRPPLVAAFDGAFSSADAIRRVGAMLVADGAATDRHVEGVVAREAEQPTGLPAEEPFALVHSDAPGAMRLAAAIGIFATPVRFRRMDEPYVVLPVRLVVMLTVPDRSHQATVISGLIALMTDADLVRRLLTLPVERARELLRERAA
jgi:mannitol/fructose-specific phosphotransferase system IIA component (Ntr-type)